MALRPRTRNLLLATTILGVGTAIVVYEPTTSDVAPAIAAASTTPTWIATATGIAYFDETGVLTTKIKADQADYFALRKEIEFTRPDIAEGGTNSTTGWQTQWQATANNAIGNNDNTSLQLNDDVNVYNLLHRYHLQSDELIVDGATQTLRSDAAVTLTGMNATIAATGFSANWLTEKIELFNDVHVQITPE